MKQDEVLRRMRELERKVNRIEQRERRKSADEILQEQADRNAERAASDHCNQRDRLLNADSHVHTPGMHKGGPVDPISMLVKNIWYICKYGFN